MKFVTFAAKGLSKPGVLSLDGRRIVPLEAAGLSYESLEAMARLATPEELDTLRRFLRENPDAGLPRETVTLLPAIPAPTQEVLVMEHNFLPDSAAAAAFQKEKQQHLPIYYYKKATFANCDGGRIPTYPGHVTELDYQAELCCVVAGDVYQVAPEAASSKIFGYLIINNVIARNLTQRHRRPYIATSLDGFLPMSAFLVTPDEVGEEITVRSYVNGQLRQNAAVGLAKFSFAEAIADLSRISVLRGGSILTLGTPFGCGCDQNPPRWLKSGDVVTCEADGVGQVTNVVE